jgi:hypothetical protein
MLNIKIIVTRFVLGVASMGTAHFALADPFESIGWSIEAKALLSTQSSEDTAQLSRTLRDTKQIVCSLELRVPLADINKMLMIRFYGGYETTWFLYRTQESAVVARLMSGGINKVFWATYGELDPSEWDEMFEKFSRFQQRPPTPPLSSDARMLPGRFWPRGYTGIVNIYDSGKIREYLLATDDLKSIHTKGPIDAFLCSTLYAGLHCRVGAEVKDGWVSKDLDQLLTRAKTAEKTRPSKPTSTLQLEKFFSKAAIEPACQQSIDR